MPKTEKRAPRAPRSDRGVQRAASAFYIMRALCIHALAAKGEPTEAIAKRFGVNRSFIIKQSTIVLKPRTDKERAILKVAKTLVSDIDFNFSVLLSGTDIKTTLAGSVKTTKPKVKAAKTKAPTKARKPRLKLAAPQPPLADENYT
jgi:hypothetical protein